MHHQIANGFWMPLSGGNPGLRSAQRSRSKWQSCFLVPRVRLDSDIRRGRTCPIRAGESVALFFNSANRDETVFADAEQFRVDRRPNPHLAFGLCQHHCIGAHMARLEMRALLKSLLPRLESAEFAATPRRTSSIMVSGISSLPVRCAWRRLTSDAASSAK